MKKLFSVMILFICLISGCSCKDEPVKTTIFSPYIRAYDNKEGNSYVLTSPFGTYVSLVGYDEDKVYDVEEQFYDLATEYHSLLDRNFYYKDSSGNIINNIKVINDSYGSGESVVVDDIIIGILKEGVKYTKLSNGKFNIVSGSVVDVWEDSFDILNQDKYKIDPTLEEINNAMLCVPTSSEIDSVLVIDEVNKTVKFNSFDGCISGASITLGALAKSYFLDKLSLVEEIIEVGPAIYDAGQSSIIVRGDNPLRSEGVWNIAISDSLNGGNVAQLQLREDSAVSTSSGQYKGYIKEDGIIRHHIIDATSGYPNSYLLGVTVVGDSAMVVDIITTTLMTMESLEEIKNYLTVLEDLDISVKVLLQVKENDTLKLYVNSDMKDNIGEVYNNVVLEEFSYGTQA